MRHTDHSPAPESGPMLPPWTQARNASSTAAGPRWSRGAKIAVGLPLGLLAAVVTAAAIVVLVLLPQLTISLSTWGAPGDQQLGEPVAEQAAEPVPPGPTRTAGPDPIDSCAISVTASTGGQHLDRATIECGTQQPLEVSGDFRHQVANHYDPNESDI